MEKEKYIVFQYLKFIWGKKWLLILCTIIFSAIGFIYAKSQSAQFSGHALIFTGNAQNDMLSKPELIKTEYKNKLPSHFEKSYDVKIPESFQIKMTLTGENKDEVEKYITKLAKTYEKDMKKRYNTQYTTMENYRNALKEKIKKIEETIINYHDLMGKTGKEEQLNIYNQALLNQEELLSEYKENFHEIEYKLALMEEPKLMAVSNTISKPNSLKYLLLGAAFGLQMMLILLVIWKYILDAKRNLVTHNEMR